MRQSNYLLNLKRRARKAKNGKYPLVDRGELETGELQKIMDEHYPDYELGVDSICGYFLKYKQEN